MMKKLIDRLSSWLWQIWWGYLHIECPVCEGTGGWADDMYYPGPTIDCGLCDAMGRISYLAWIKFTFQEYTPEKVIDYLYDNWVRKEKERGR